LIFITYPLVWSQMVVDKIWQKHHVTPEEVEEANYDNKPVCHKGTSNSYRVYGQAISGRYLFIVLGRRRRRAQYKVITARDMQDREASNEKGGKKETRKRAYTSV
jgi:uncharacterized DUF497 family protein